MPIYEYQCDSCGAHTERLERTPGASGKRCDGCGAEALRRLVSAPSFRLSGGGWYETDFKKEGRKNIARSDTDSGSSDQSAKSSKSDKPGKSAESAKPDKSAKPAASPAGSGD